MKENQKQVTGFNFWRNVDTARREKTIKEIADLAGIGYQLLRAQRSDNTLPRVDNAYKIAKALNTTCEFLVSGKREDPDGYSDYVKHIKDMETKDPEKLRIIREMLEMKAEKKGTVSSSGSMVG